MSGPAGSSQWIYTREFDILNSARFNKDDSAFLEKTGSAGNRRTFTLSLWFKTHGRGVFQRILEAGANTQNQCLLTIDNGDKLRVTASSSNSSQMSFKTNLVTRDPTHWYHVVWAVDSTQGTNTDRVNIYVNGMLQTDFETATYPSQNADFHINTEVAHRIGSIVAGGDYFDGNMAEYHFVDGLQLNATSFGETDDTYGHWKPKQYLGAHGTNGWYLDFKDASNLGNDAVGGTDFGETNIAAADQSLDTPTNNFATWNIFSNEATSVATLTEGGLKGQVGNDFNGTTATMNVLDGKTYVEARVTAIDSGKSIYIGIFASNELYSAQKFYDTDPAYAYRSDGLLLYGGGSNISTGINTFAAGDIIQLAIDTDANKIWVGKNNTWQTINNASQDPSNGTGGYSITDEPEGYAVGFGSGSANASNTNLVVNFGQDSSFAGGATAQGNGENRDDFYYEPPTGFKSMNSRNLPEPAVVPQNMFGILTYTGNGGGSENVITGLNFKPDLVWIKDRAAASSTWVDSLRGPARYFSTDSAEAEGNRSLGVKRFTSDGMALGDNNGTSGNNMNRDGNSYVAWCWNMSATAGTGGGTTSTSHNQSNIDTEFRANSAAGQSILTYTGDGAPGQGVAHGLGVSPHLFILKNRGQGDDWFVFHRTVTTQNHLHWNTNDLPTNNPNTWAQYGPVSNAFTVNAAGNTNVSNETYVAYTFEDVPGYSKFGSYYGNGDASDGPYVYLGFRPSLVIVKKISDAAHNWVVVDDKREPINDQGDVSFLLVDTNAAEDTDPCINLLSNGFVVLDTAARYNTNGSQYIYLAWASLPGKYTNAR